MSVEVSLVRYVNRAGPHELRIHTKSSFVSGHKVARAGTTVSGAHGLWLLNLNGLQDSCIEQQQPAKRGKEMISKRKREDKQSVSRNNPKRFAKAC